MIMSFECVVDDNLRLAIDGYLHPKNPFLSLTDGFFVENEAYYFKMRNGVGDKRLVLIVENGVFDVIAQYVASVSVMGFLFSLLNGSQVLGSVLYVSIVLLVVSLSYLSGKVRFSLLRWRINKVVDSKLKMEWLNKEQVISRFIYGVKKDESK